MALEEARGLPWGSEFPGIHGYPVRALLFCPKSLCAQSQSGVLCHVTTWANGQKRVPGHFACPPGPAVSWIFVGARSLLEAQGSYSGMDIGQVGCPN